MDITHLVAVAVIAAVVAAMYMPALVRYLQSISAPEPEPKPELGPEPASDGHLWMAVSPAWLQCRACGAMRPQVPAGRPPYQRIDGCTCLLCNSDTDGRCPDAAHWPRTD